MLLPGVGGRVALVNWAMFVICAPVTAIGAVSAAAVAIVAPVAMGFALRYQIHPMMMGMMVVQGATSFSPIGIFGSITNDVVESNDIPGNQPFLFLTTFTAATIIAVITYFVFGGRQLIARGTEADNVMAMTTVAEAASRTSVSGTPYSAVEASRSFDDAGEPTDAHRLDPQRIVTLVDLVALMVGARLRPRRRLHRPHHRGHPDLAFPKSAKGAVKKVSWGTVLLIGGIVTYINLLQNEGVVTWLGGQVAAVSTPLVAPC